MTIIGAFIACYYLIKFSWIFLKEIYKAIEAISSSFSSSSWLAIEMRYYCKRIKKFIGPHSFNVVKIVYGKSSNYTFSILGIFGPKLNEEVVTQELSLIQSEGDLRSINDLTIIDGALLRLVFLNQNTMNTYPLVQSNSYDLYRPLQIKEWAYSNYLEATIEVMHESGLVVDFFATDYFFNKALYQQKEVELNIIGITVRSIIIDEFSTQFSMNADFSEFQVKTLEEVKNDVLVIFGHVNRIDDYKLENSDKVEGYILNVNITPEYTLDIFANPAMLPIDPDDIEEGHYIHVVVCLQGCLKN